MKRGEGVYFFTLIDVLLTTLFLCLALAAAARKRNETAAELAATDSVQVAKLTELAGVSDLAELTDELTRLVPLRDAREDVGVVRQLGGAHNARRLAELQERAGGADSLLGRVQRLLSKEGAGRPHCLFTTDGKGKKIPIPIAHILATDDGMTFMDSTAALATVLGELGLSFQAVRVLSDSAFREAFAPLRRKSCAYTVRVRERTNLKFARQALYGLFYTWFDPR